MNFAIAKNAPLLDAAVLLCVLSGCATMSPARTDGLMATDSSGAVRVVTPRAPEQTRPLRFDVRIDVPNISP